MEYEEPVSLWTWKLWLRLKESADKPSGLDAQRLTWGPDISEGVGEERKRPVPKDQVEEGKCDGGQSKHCS